MKYMKFLSLLALIAGMGFSAVTGQQPEGELWEEFTKGLEQTRAEGRGRSLKSFKRYIERIDRYAAKFNPTEWKEIIDRFFSPLRTKGEMLEAVESGELEKNYFEYKLEKDLVRLKRSLQKLLPLVKKEAEIEKQTSEFRKKKSSLEREQVLRPAYRQAYEEAFGRKPTEEELDQYIYESEEAAPAGYRKEKEKISNQRLKNKYQAIENDFRQYDDKIIKPALKLLQKIQDKNFTKNTATKALQFELKKLFEEKQQCI